MRGFCVNKFLKKEYQSGFFICRGGGKSYNSVVFNGFIGSIDEDAKWETKKNRMVLS